MTLVPLTRKPNWKIVLDSLLDNIPVDISGMKYAFFNKDQIIDTVPESDSQYQVLSTGFFALYMVEEDGVAQPSRWMHCSDSIQFVFDIAKKATDNEITLIVGNRVLNSVKGIRNI